MKYKRILIKLSGESLQGSGESGISPFVLKEYVSQIIDLQKMNCELGIVIGGGNIFRGLKGSSDGFDRVKGDQMGMLATVINSLALESEFISQGVKAKVYTSIRMEPVGEFYSRDKVVNDMQNGIIVILAGGTSNPFFTTDTAAALRAIETESSVLLKGTRVDGVYDSDPEKNPAAIRYDMLSFKSAIDKGLKIMDQTAFTMCRENNMPIIVFNMNTPGNLGRIVRGEKCGTLVKND
jgi:uridylate kinase